MLPGGVFSTRFESDIAILRTRMHWLLLGLGLVGVFTLPLYANVYWLSWATKLVITVVAVLGVHILTGLCGLFSIGQAAFVGVGAYTVAILTSDYGLNAWLCLPICGLSAGVVGLFFGLPCFRLRGFYLAISTLAASYIIIWCIEHFTSVTGGYIGKGVDPLTLGGIDFGSRGAFYCLAVTVMILCTVIAKNIQRTATGRAFVAIRDNELAAEVSGIPIFRYKMVAFFIGCMFAGLAGWLWAYSQLWIAPYQFTLLDSIWFVGMLIIGGWGSTAGVFMGASFLRLIEILIDHIAPSLAGAFPSLAREIHIALSLILYGLVILLFLMFVPNGLYSRWEKLKTYYRLYPYSFSAGSS